MQPEKQSSAPRGPVALPVLAVGAVVSGLLLCAPAARAASQGTPASAAAPVSAASAAPVGRARISSLTIDGGTVFTQNQMERAMGIGASNWLSWYSHDDIYSSARLARGVSDLRAFYITRGYLRFAVKNVKVTPSDDGKTVAITLTVSEGRLYTLSAVNLGGDPDGLVNTPGLTQALQRALPVGARITRDGLDAAQRAVVAQLGHEGYAHAKVTPHFAIDDSSATVALTLAVDRGVPQTSPVQQAASPKGAELPAVPGTAGQGAGVAGGAGGGQAQQAQAQAQAPEQDASGAPGEIDIGKQHGMDLRVGVGYSTADRAFVFGGASYPDAFGKGHDADASVSFGSVIRAAQISETDKQFTSSGISRSTGLWYRSDEPFHYLDGADFRVAGAGVYERFDIPMSAADSVFIAPGFEHDWLGDIGSTGTPGAYQQYVQRAGSMTNATTLRAGWTHDMRDSAAMPTRGYIWQGSAEYGVPGLGANYLKLDTDGRYYVPLWGDTVLSFSGHGGYGMGWGNKGFPIEKYYYLGGPDTVRGYAVNSLGPRDTLTGYPIGGRRMLAGSVELMQPITRGPVDQGGRLVGVLFVDGGNVWDGLPGGQSTGGARFSYGTGLGWQLPFGVLKVDFALPIKRHQGDDYQRFQLQFNAGF